ncbi:MAG: hypothetical protein U0359_20900 [Byssovorax sp.]
MPPTLAPPAIAALRATLLREGAVPVRGFVERALTAAIDRALDEDDLEEAWSACPAGAEVVDRARRLLGAMFGFVILDPFRVERTPGQPEGVPRAEIKSLWHRDNWPVTRDHASERRFFLCRPVLLLEDLDAEALGPTEYLPGTHLRARWEEPIDQARPAGVRMLGEAGDLWLMASRVVHRRAFPPADLPPDPRLRKVAWMVAKTEVAHP